MPVEIILSDAKKFAESASSHVDFHVYEYYKQLLHSHGHFGYEQQLANILKI